MVSLAMVEALNEHEPELLGPKAGSPDGGPQAGTFMHPVFSGRFPWDPASTGFRATAHAFVLVAEYCPFPVVAVPPGCAPGCRTCVDALAEACTTCAVGYTAIPEWASGIDADDGTWCFSA